jgi:DNA-binding Lrp family transcriptional regulator
MTVDERDVRLLKAIAELETGSPERLHEETGIPVSTIHYRLNGLREAGIVENDLYDFDLDELGLGVQVIVHVFADFSGSHDEIAERIREVEGVTHVYFTMGEYDFVVIGQLADSDAVETFVRTFEELEGVRRTDSTFVISNHHEDDRALRSYDRETLVEELADEE